MNRIHLFEFEDQQWFPAFLRNYGTDCLQFLSNKTKMYRPIVPLLEKAIKESGTNQIIDLGSGGGGGLIWLSEELKKNNPGLKIMLTDYYPNIPAFEYLKTKSTTFDYLKTSIDARNIPKELKGIRTQFLSFHHFNPTDVKSILQNAVDAEQSIAIFEGQERSIRSIATLLFIPIPVLLITPFIKPFKIGRFFFTYLIPIIPFFVLWDGIASAFRTYSVKEMKGLVSELNNHQNYNWKIGRIKSAVGVILYLIGTKKQ